MEKSPSWRYLFGLIHRASLTVLYVASIAYAIYKNAVLKNQDLTVISKIGINHNLFSSYLVFRNFHFLQELECICMAESVWWFLRIGKHGPKSANPINCSICWPTLTQTFGKYSVTLWRSINWNGTFIDSKWRSMLPSARVYSVQSLTISSYSKSKIFSDKELTTLTHLYHVSSFPKQLRWWKHVCILLCVHWTTFRCGHHHIAIHLLGEISSTTI